MGPIYELTGDELSRLRSALGVPDDDRSIYQIRVCIDGGFKISINHGTWSPPMGKEWK